MNVPSFLDKGVLLGFCFRTDPHHSRCRDYLESDVKPHITEEIDESFERNRKRMTEDHTDAIRLHVKDLRESHHHGVLGEDDLENIRQNVLFKGNQLSEFLDRWYNSQVNSGITLSEVQDRLRYLARDIERRAYRRKEEFDTLVILWEREDEYPEVENKLPDMSVEDMFVCIDAHDLAVRKEADAELATTDKSDFIESGRKERILEATALEGIVNLGA